MLDFKNTIFDTCNKYVRELLEQKKISKNRAIEIMQEITGILKKNIGIDILDLLELLMTKYPLLKAPLLKLMEKYDDE